MRDFSINRYLDNQNSPYPIKSCLYSNAGVWARWSEKWFEVVRNVATAPVEDIRRSRASGWPIRTSQCTEYAEHLQVCLAVYALIVATSARTGAPRAPDSDSFDSSYVTALVPRNDDASDEPGADWDAYLARHVTRLWLSHFELYPMSKTTVAFADSYGQSSPKAIYTDTGIYFYTYVKNDRSIMSDIC